MRNITKIFLLIVAVFVAYLVWPRTVNIKGFKPDELARLQVEAWQAEQAGKSGAALWARFRIYTSQYHFSPVAAFRMAQNEGRALAGIKPTPTEATADADAAVAPADTATLQAFTEKYAAMKRMLGASFDADELAREEYSWRSLLVDHAPAAQLTAPVSNILAGLYGGTPADFATVATDLVNAQGYVFGTVQPADGMAPLPAAKMAALDGFKLLKEVAEAPAPAAEAAGN